MPTSYEQICFLCAVDGVSGERADPDQHGRKGRATANIFIERLWCTVKQDYVYLYPAADGAELYEGLDHS